MMRITQLTVFSLFACQVVSYSAEAGPPPLTLGPDISTQYDEAFSLHGIAGDGALIFALQPTSVPNHPLGVYVSRRGDGAHVGAVTPPPKGWQTPLAMKVTTYRDEGLVGTSGSFLILDGFTPQATSEQAVVYEYDYSYSLERGLRSSLVATHPLPLLNGVDSLGLPNGPAYPVSLAVLPDKTVVVIDFVLGSIWTLAPGSNTWALAMIDSRFELG
jgi:hypothetical protein